MNFHSQNEQKSEVTVLPIAVAASIFAPARRGVRLLKFTSIGLAELTHSVTLPQMARAMASAGSLDRQPSPAPM